jgi:mRNA-degrading endonuclease RelE of RelBE toxin-antitoxin system
MEVLIHKKAKKKFEGISDMDLKQRLKETFKLLSDPFSLDTIKIKGEERTYRTRIGKYRILFIIEEKIVYIVDFDARGKVYK